MLKFVEKVDPIRSPMYCTVRVLCRYIGDVRTKYSLHMCNLFLGICVCYYYFYKMFHKERRFTHGHNNTIPMCYCVSVVYSSEIGKRFCSQQIVP